MEEQGYSVAEILQQHFGFEPASVDQAVSATATDTDSAAVLQCEPREPALMIERLYRSGSGDPPYQLTRSLGPAKRVKVESRFVFSG